MTTRTDGLGYPKKWKWQVLQVTAKDWLDIYSTTVGWKFRLVKPYAIEMETSFTADSIDWTTELNTLRISEAGQTPMQLLRQQVFFIGRCYLTPIQKKQVEAESNIQLLKQGKAPNDGYRSGANYTSRSHTVEVGALRHSTRQLSTSVK